MPYEVIKKEEQFFGPSNKTARFEAVVESYRKSGREFDDFDLGVVQLIVDIKDMYDLNYSRMVDSYYEGRSKEHQIYVKRERTLFALGKALRNAIRLVDGAEGGRRKKDKVDHGRCSSSRNNRKVHSSSSK